MSHAVNLYSGEIEERRNYSIPIEAEDFLGMIAASGKKWMFLVN